MVSNVTTRCCYVFILFRCFIAAAGYSETPQRIMYGDTTPGITQIWQIKDSRDDGISFETKKAMLALHLKDTYHGKKLDEFSLPGTQQLKLEYAQALESKKSEALLGVLETLELSSDSMWDIDISGRGGFGNRTILSNVLHRLPNVTSVHWTKEEPIPVDIIQFLEARHPFCRLFYELPLYHWESGHTDPKIDRRLPTSQQGEVIAAAAAAKRVTAIARESVLNSSILHSLKVQVSNGAREKRKPWKMDLILRILTTCSNIKELDISVTRGAGCVVFNNNDPYGFDFTSSNSTIGALESLTVDGYRFHGKPNGQDWMEWEADHPQSHILKAPWKYLPDSVINYVGFPKINSLGGLESSFVKRDTSPLKPGTKTNLDIWLERMDWTHLHTFKIKGRTTRDLELFGGDILPSLRNVAFSGYYANHHAILEFLGSISSNLESIQFDGINFCSVNKAVDAITEHHGSSLRTLVIKHSTPGHSLYPMRSRSRSKFNFPVTSFINVTHLVQLRDKAPGIVSLDLDIYIAKEWNYELLDALASFPELEHLTLRFEAQIKDSDWIDQDEEDTIWDEEENAIHSSDSEFRSNEIELTLMMGLKAYLRKQKVGKPFKVVETWVGSELMKDIAELC
jgi:hypothetical protein